MSSSGILRRVALVRTDVSEELSASFIRVTRIDELETTLAVTSSQRILMEALSSSETSVLTKATRRNISEDTILQATSSRRFHVLYKYVRTLRVRRHQLRMTYYTPQAVPSPPLYYLSAIGDTPLCPKYHSSRGALDPRHKSTLR
jgi:hypothetical protein